MSPSGKAAEAASELAGQSGLGIDNSLVVFVIIWFCNNAHAPIKMNRSPMEGAGASQERWYFLKEWLGPD